MTNLSQNYHQYIKLQNAIRFNPEKENVGMLLQEIQEPGRALSGFEKEYATWTQSLWDRVNVDAVKTEIKRLAAKLRQEKDEKVQLMPYDSDIVRVTKLCALRAAMRGKLHFSPRTDINKAIWCLRIPVSDKKYNATTTRWEGVVDLKAQMEWVEKIAEEFMK